MSASTTNRVWIELEKPRDDEHAVQICDRANRMLARLAEAGDPSGRFHWSKKEQRFCYGTGMGYVSLSDRGEWFSLDYFGRE